MTDKVGIYKKLLDAMKSMENPTKSKQAYKYKYETLEQVLGIVRPALASQGLMLTQRQSRTHDEWMLVTEVFDEDGEILVMDTRPIPHTGDAQSQGSWETYLRRYALRTAFGLTGEDDDGAATLPKNKNNGGSYAKSQPITVTEMASDQLMEKIDIKIEELAGLKGKTFDEVKDALMSSKTMQGAKSYEEMTKDQANSALCLAIKWVDAAKPEYYEEDQEF